MLEAVKTTIFTELENIVGSEFVSSDQADLFIYSQDMTPAEPVWPAARVLVSLAGEGVVHPGSAPQVSV